MPGHLKACLIAALLIFWMLLSAVANTPRVDVSMRGGFAFAPTDWWILVKVDPQAENRALVVEADGSGERRSSYYALDGEKSWRLKQIWYKRLTEGCYRFTASLYRNVEATDFIGSATSPPLAVSGRGIEGNPCD